MFPVSHLPPGLGKETLAAGEEGSAEEEGLRERTPAPLPEGLGPRLGIPKWRTGRNAMKRPNVSVLLDVLVLSGCEQEEGQVMVIMVDVLVLVGWPPPTPKKGSSRGGWISKVDWSRSCLIASQL